MAQRVLIQLSNCPLCVERACVSKKLVSGSTIFKENNGDLKKNINDKTNLFLTPYIAEEIYKDAKQFTLGLEYIVDTFQVVDYWSPDKKR